MTNEVDRRRWIGRILKSVAAWGATDLLRAVDYDKPAPGSEKLTAEQSNGLMIFRWNNRAIAAYRALSSQKFPFFYPLAGPATGLSLLAESALPYPMPSRFDWRLHGDGSIEQRGPLSFSTRNGLDVRFLLPDTLRAVVAKTRLTATPDPMQECRIVTIPHARKGEPAACLESQDNDLVSLTINKRRVALAPAGRRVTIGSI